MPIDMYTVGVMEEVKESPTISINIGFITNYTSGTRIVTNMAIKVSEENHTEAPHPAREAVCCGTHTGLEQCDRT